jgi:hypothetical protein
VHPQSRQLRNLTAGFPDVAAAVAQLDDVVVDGELVVWRAGSTSSHCRTGSAPGQGGWEILSRPRPPRRTLLAAGGRGVSDDAAMTTRKRDARSHRRNWTTIAVTPCPPGWGIVYDIRGIRDDDDTADYEIRPCPAILLQELRTTSVYVTAEGEVETITHESPYDTRAVFADHEDGVLRPVDEVSNFVRALGPGEHNPPKSSHPVDARTRGGRSD